MVARQIRKIESWL